MSTPILLNTALHPDMTLGELVGMLTGQLVRHDANRCEFELSGIECAKGKRTPVKLAFEVSLHKVQ